MRLPVRPVDVVREPVALERRAAELGDCATTAAAAPPASGAA